MKFRSLVVALIWGFSLAACFPSEPLDPYGVTLQDGEPAWVYAPGCSNNLAFALVLQDGMEMESERLWEARALGEHHPVTGFVIGEPPEGYEDVIAFDHELDPDRQYVARVLWGSEDDFGVSGRVFTPSQLDPGHVLHRRGLLPEAEFRRDFACEGED